MKKTHQQIATIITHAQMTYQQKVAALAGEAEGLMPDLPISKEARTYWDDGYFDDLFEGRAPYRPRYILPDYQKLFQQGSTFLELAPPTSLSEAIHTLLITYHYVPSITALPVFLGNLDQLFAPFIDGQGLDDQTALAQLKLFFIHVDRTVANAFAHANLGPHPTRAGSLILAAERALQHAVPNLTLKYDPKLTSDAFALEAITTALHVAKPYFSNHQLNQLDYGKSDNSYGVASCYNTLPMAGGSYTLMRLNLKRVAQDATSVSDFLEQKLPHAVRLMSECMDHKIRFLVEESNFFTTDFLVQEGLIKKENFSAMFGIFGLAECCDHLLQKKDDYGKSGESSQLAHQILAQLRALLAAHHNPHCHANGGHFWLHGQSGMPYDEATSPAARIPIGQEVPLLQHLQFSAPLHHYFNSGTSDIYLFDHQSLKNPQAILDLVKGAMASGMRTMAIGSEAGDVVRVTGYLVKRSEMEKVSAGQAILHGTDAFGVNSAPNSHFLKREIYSLERLANRKR